MSGLKKYMSKADLRVPTIEHENLDADNDHIDVEVSREYIEGFLQEESK